MDNNYSGKLNIDVSGFNKALKEAKANLALAASEFKLAKEQGSAFESVSDKLSRKLEALNKVYNESTNKTELLKKKYEALKNELGETNEKVINAKKAWIDSKTETEKLSNEIIRYNKALEDNKETTESCIKCNENVCHSLTMFQQAVLDAAEALAEKLATALVDFTKETVNAGLQFETAFAGVKKVVDGTEEDFAGLQAEIRKTATEKPISADTLASLYQAGAQLGIQKENLKDFTNAIIDLQNTSDLTAEAGATMIAQYANVMNLPAEDYARFASTLSYLGSTTATTESRIMDMAQRMSGAAGSIGMTNQGVLALATAMGSVGLSAESAGSAISTIMLNIETAVATSSEKLNVWAETAGMTASEFSKLWKIDVVSAIQAVIKGLSDEKAGGESLILTLNELGIKNIRQKSTMLQLANAGDLLTETIKKANTEWENNTYLADASNQVYTTTANQMILLKNSFKEVQLSIYDDLAKPLQDVTKDLTEFLKSDEVAKFFHDFATELVKIGETASIIIKGIITNFDKITAVVKTVTPIVAGLVTKFIAFKTISFAKGIVNDVKNLITSLIQATTAQEGLNVAMSTNPIGAVATAIGLLITALMGLNTVLGSTKDGLSEVEKQILENNATRDKEIAGIESEYNHYQDLINELKTLVDENGNVKTGYEERVNAIIPLLQNATGEEITLINNQIQGYDNLITKLDEVIAKKRAEAKMSAYEGDYKEALKNEDELKRKKKELEDRIARDKAKDDGSIGLRADSTGVTAARNDLSLAESELQDINAQLKNGTDIIDKYEKMLSDYTETYVNNIKKTKKEADGVVNGTVGQSVSTGVTTTPKTTTTAKASKTKEKTESDLVKEGNYTYQELTNLQEKYKNDLKIYADEMKKGNSAVTVAMVEETKKNLDTVESKIKSMKEILGTTPTNLMSTENDNTEEQLEAKKKILKDTLSQLGAEMKNGNTAITNEMLDQINKAIDQTDAKLQNLKNKYDTINSEDGEEDEISEEINTGEEVGLTSSGVIYGAGVLDEKAIEDNASKQAQMEAEAYRQAEIALQEERALAEANENAMNKQAATLDPSNLEIYDTTNRLLAEQEQISHAEGLNDNAYRVVEAEVNTLNQAKQMALTVDFTCIGRYICQGIVNGINANKHLVVDAVRSMMAEANSSAEDEEEIGSPSKVFYRYGMYIDQGLANGIKDYTSEVVEKVRNMSVGLQNGIKGIDLAVNATKMANLPTLNNIGQVSKPEVNYYFTQHNTSNKSLDTLAIYKQSKSLLKREIRNQYV